MFLVFEVTAPETLAASDDEDGLGVSDVLMVPKSNEPPFYRTWVDKYCPVSDALNEIKKFWRGARAAQDGGRRTYSSPLIILKYL